MELLVTADDRTGAYETAAVLADRGVGSIEVTAWPDVDERSDVAVIDLATRHVVEAEAARRVRAIDGRPTQLRAHKIDSRLRGNWAAEIAALAGGAPVLLVPALPAMGRTCVGGVVREHGAPIEVSDVRNHVADVRPARMLASVVDSDVGVVEAGDGEAVRSWLDCPAGVCVADAETDAEVTAIVAAWRRADEPVVLAGTSAVIGAIAPNAASPAPRLSVRGTALIVCGSVHPSARRQLAALERSELASKVYVIASPESRAVVAPGEADAMAQRLAARARSWLREQSVGVIVLVGGDTAAAFVGAERLTVHGSAGAGLAVGRLASLDIPLVTRSGGFGDVDALTDLIRATLRS